jgi:hypothetical protein
MGRARGANALMNVKEETTYGTPPTGNYIQMPYVSTDLGPEQGLIESDLLGQGREPEDPVLDVVNNNGNLVVPVDVRAFGHWLKLYFGDPVTAAGGAASGDIVFSAQPAADSTITINGTPFTFKASGATGNQSNIGATLSDTLDSLVTVLNSSGVSGVAEATYSKTGSNTTLHVVHDAAGLAGNAFTLVAGAGSNGTVSAATLAGGTVTHTFTSGGSSLPSQSIEIAMPDVPSYEMNYGARGGTMKIGLSRRGLLNATLGLVAKGANDPVGTSGGGTPTTIDVLRFAQATGEITQDGVQLGSVVAAELNYSNNLDPVETIQPDGEIEDADAGMAGGMGNITLRFKDLILLNKAKGRTPVALTFGWTVGDFGLLFTYERALLPRSKRPITGPKGIQASFDWQASGADGHVCTVVLTNDVASY